jgi:hypothetical protein
LHGLAVAVPTGWEDFSVHRFAAPVDDSNVALPARARVKTAGAGPQFRTNVVVARTAVPPDGTLGSAFTASNDEARAHNATFQIVRGPVVTTTKTGQAVAWQDTSALEAGGTLQVFQRHIATMASPGSLGLLTITSVRSDLAALSKQLGFDLEAT